MFWKATAIRAIKTICQTAVAMIGTALYFYEIDWQMVLSASLLAGIVSVLTSIATGLPEVELADVLEEDDEDFDELDEGEETDDMEEE